MPSGSCICGNVRYEVQGDSGASILCHCVDCRKISGGAFSANSVFSDEGFKVTQGTPKQHKKKADGGNEIVSNFCGDCGSTMWRQGATFPGKVIVKAGTLDDTKILDNFKADAELYAPTRPKWLPAQEGAAQNNGMS